MLQGVIACGLIRDGDYCLRGGESDVLPLDQATKYKSFGWVSFVGDSGQDRESVVHDLNVNNIAHGQEVSGG